MKKNAMEKLENLILDYVAKKDVDNLVEILLLSPEQCENFAKKGTQYSFSEGKKLFSTALDKAQRQRLQNAEHEKRLLEYLQTYSGRKNIEIYTEPYWLYLYLQIIINEGGILSICKVLPNMSEDTIRYFCRFVKQEYPSHYIRFKMLLAECNLAKDLLKSKTELIPRDILAQKQEEYGLTPTEAAMYLIHMKFIKPYDEGAW